MPAPTTHRKSGGQPSRSTAHAKGRNVIVSYYWIGNPDVPFYDLRSTLSSSAHPEAAPENYEQLKEATKLDPPPEWIVSFKAQLVRVLQGDADGLRPGAISDAAEYEDGSDEAFLKRLWSDLYPDEPLPTPRS